MSEAQNAKKEKAERDSKEIMEKNGQVAYVCPSNATFDFGNKNPREMMNIMVKANGDLLDNEDADEGDDWSVDTSLDTI